MIITDFKNIAEVELIYKTKIRSCDRPKVKSSNDAFNLIRQFYSDDNIEHHEKVMIMLLNRSNSLLGVQTISTGGTSGSLIDVKIVLQYCIKANASSFIIVHNHPSGNTDPSESDLRISKKLLDAGKLIEITFLDHLIITKDNGYYSVADNGQLD